MSTRGFRHIGRVISIDSTGVVQVSLECATMCDGCHAKGACPSAKGENRVVSVESDQSSGLSLGDSVEVGVSYQVGAIAVLLAYIVPLLLFVLTILGVVLLGLDEAVAALLGFALTTLYYVWLYSIRDKMRRVVRFYIKRK